MTHPSRQSRPSVLIVESRQELLDALTATLSSGLVVTVAGSTREAIVGFERFEPRVVLISIHQPKGQEALTIASELRKQSAGRPCVIVVYGSHLPPGVRLAQLSADYGVDDVVLGSVTLKRIEEKVFEHLKLGWVAVKSEEPEAERPEASSAEGQEDWTNPFTSSTVVTARKDAEEDQEKPETAPPPARSIFGRLWRR